ncbi:MAG: YihY/virulence factor BrkB family protein [Thermomicrobiales bacterium]
MAQVSKSQIMDVGKTTWGIVRKRDLMGMAQQIAYNVLFAIGPLLIFVTALAGAITQQVNKDADNPVRPITNWMNENLPADSADFLQTPVENALTTSPGFLLSIGALLALWGGRNAISVLMKGLNLAMGIDEHRSWVRQQLTALGLTIAAGIGLALVSLLFVLGSGVGEDIAKSIGLGTAWTTVSTWLRWPVIVIVVVVAVAMLNRFAPDHEALVRWYLPGAVTTVVLWGLSLIGLRIYFQISAGFAEAYGVFGSVLAFIFFLYVMSLGILVGGVVNGAIQREVPEPESEPMPDPAT